jgi:hypothetical protein
MLTAYNIHQMLEIEKFRTWLESFDDSDDVGYTREESICPIAQYLTDTINANDETGEDYLSDQPSDNVPVRKEMAIQTLDETIESLAELECESQEIMLKEYSYNV